MKTKEAQAVLFLNKTHPKLDGKCSVYIRITFNRIRKFYPTSKSLTIDEFSKIFMPSPGKALKATADQLKKFEVDAKQICSSMSNFTFEAFEKKFITNRTVNDTVAGLFDAIIKKLTDNDQIGTAVSYGCAKKSLETFKPGLKLIDITVTWLYSYEKWMLENEKSTTTISMYLRHLRTIFNNAISDGLINQDAYPFGKRKYEVPEANNTKKALTFNDVLLIVNYKAEPKTTTERMQAYWLFMPFANGLNVKDMSLLKYENIKGEFIEFQRAKTVRTKRKIEKIRVFITPEIDSIIKKFGNRNHNADSYLFPILTKGVDATRERQLIQQITGVVNDHIKIIGKAVGIDQHITTYSCRHTFSTILQRSGVSIEFISEALGHSNIRTTQAYLKGFEDEKKKEVAQIFSNFNKPTANAKK